MGGPSNPPSIDFETYLDNMRRHPKENQMNAPATRRIVNARFGPVAPGSEQSQTPAAGPTNERFRPNNPGIERADAIVKSALKAAKAIGIGVPRPAASNPSEKRGTAKPKESPAKAPFVQNTVTGMSLAYWERLDELLQGAAFVGRNSIRILSGLLHAVMPFLFAWTATHWNDDVRNAFFSSGGIAGALEFLMVWISCFFIWAAAWAGATGIVAKAWSAVEEMGRAGERFVAQRDGKKNR